MKPKELILFIDWQNVYKSARDAFFLPQDSGVYGQINPIELGNLICLRKATENVTLKQIRIYSGQPAVEDRKTYAAHTKQFNRWRKEPQVNIITRPLRYPTNSKPQEKGVDVALAVDFVAMAVDDDYDVGVIASTDTDLKPALEFVHKRFADTLEIEVVAWKSRNFQSRLSVARANIWCHFLYKEDYDKIADLRNYNL